MVTKSGTDGDSRRGAVQVPGDVVLNDDLPRCVVRSVNIRVGIRTHINICVQCTDVVTLRVVVPGYNPGSESLAFFFSTKEERRNGLDDIRIHIVDGLFPSVLDQGVAQLDPVVRSVATGAAEILELPRRHG